MADADTLFGATTRGLLIHLDFLGIIHLHWSPLILEEMSRALMASGRKEDMESARRHEQLMRSALPHAEVATARVQRHFSAVATALRSAKDVHVAACAHALLAHDAGQPLAVSLVTRNLRDFGIRKLGAMGIKVMHPDDFLLELLRQDERGLAAAFASLRATLKSAPPPESLLDRLAADGQTKSADALQRAWRLQRLAL